MGFKIARRLTAVTGLNIRTENHGKEKRKAVDISIAFTGDAKLFDQLVPVQSDGDNTASEFFFNEDGHLRVPTINPIKLNRNPEGLQVTFYDKKDSPMILASSNAKDFVIELNEGASIRVTCKIQALPEKGYVERLKEILASSCEMMIEAEQDDLFADPPEPTEKDKAQAELLDQALDGRRPHGIGRNEGLRQSEVKDQPEAKDEDDGDAPPAKAKKAKKAPAKKKSGGKR